MKDVRDRLHSDRLFPADPTVRDIARRLYAAIRDLPIISPHGHTDPQWFADNADGTGPYKITSYERGTQITLAKNEGWWKGWQPGSIDEIATSIREAEAVFDVKEFSGRLRAVR